MWRTLEIKKPQYQRIDSGGTFLYQDNFCRYVVHVKTHSPARFRALGFSWPYRLEGAAKDSALHVGYPFYSENRSNPFSEDTYAERLVSPGFCFTTKHGNRVSVRRSFLRAETRDARRLNSPTGLEIVDDIGPHNGIEITYAHSQFRTIRDLTGGDGDSWHDLVHLNGELVLCSEPYAELIRHVFGIERDGPVPTELPGVKKWEFAEYCEAVERITNKASFIDDPSKVSRLRPEIVKEFRIRSLFGDSVTAYENSLLDQIEAAAAMNVETLSAMAAVLPSNSDVARLSRSAERLGTGFGQKHFATTLTRVFPALQDTPGVGNVLTNSIEPDPSNASISEPVS